jgi:Zn-dependent protease with chaperone function
MTTSAIVPVRRRLEGIHSRTWEHSADRAALRTMRAIPGFDEALKKIVGAFGERGARLAFQADAVRISAKQFPRLHRLWLGVQDTLDAPEEYELYVSQSPFVNAGAYGFDKPWVILRSGALRLLTDAEVESVMGHELGHVLSGHALYHTMMVILIELATAGFPILGIAVMPIILALKEWFRKSELSADRAGLLAVQNPDASLRSFMRLAGGGTDEETDLNEFLLQAEEYRKTEGLMDQVMKVLNTLGRTHPFLVMRAAVLRDWIEEGEYDRVMRGEYPRRGDDQPPWSEDLADGLRHYTGGAQEAAEKAGEAVRRMRDAFDRGFRGSKSDEPKNGEADAGDTTEQG